MKENDEIVCGERTKVKPGNRMKKIEHYKLNNRNNSEKLLENGVYMFRGNNGAGAFFISFNKQNIDVEINLLEGGSEDEFANWLIKNY
jgi:hypothetical protein